MNILDILDTMVASNVEASVAANGVRDNVIACDDEENKNEQQGYEKEGMKAQKVNDTLDGQKKPNKVESSISRRKRSLYDFSTCCDKLYVLLPVVEDDNVKDVHNEWVGSYLLQSEMSTADLLVYERQITQKRYLYIRRQCFL